MLIYQRNIEIDERAVRPDGACRTCFLTSLKSNFGAANGGKRTGN